MSLSKRIQNNPINNPNYFSKCIETSREKSKENKENYIKNPNKCRYCLKILDYEKRKNSFCNKICAAKFNNALRTKEQHELRIQKIREVNKTVPNISEKERNRLYTKKSKWKKNGLYNVEGEFSYLYFIVCKCCKRTFAFNKGSKRYCNQCKLQEIKEYRLACKFNLNKDNHKFLFKKELIKKYGWYNASNNVVKEFNLNGLTWDHLFRVEDGFVLGISPKIMNHPANAELVPWLVNRKRTESMISLEELKERIYLYENGQIEKLKFFYKDDK
jgi:hypothetical protein